MIVLKDLNTRIGNAVIKGIVGQHGVSGKTKVS